MASPLVESSIASYTYAHERSSFDGYPGPRERRRDPLAGARRDGDVALLGGGHHAPRRGAGPPDAARRGDAARLLPDPRHAVRGPGPGAADERAGGCDPELAESAVARGRAAGAQ